MSEASVPSEVILLSGGYITAQIPSLPSQLSSLWLKTRPSQRRRRRQQRREAPSLRGGQRLALCHRSDKPGLCTGPGRGLALLWVGNSGGINSELTQRTALHHMKTLPESPLAPSLAGGVEDHMLRMWRSSSQAETGRILFGPSDIHQRYDWCSAAAENHIYVLSECIPVFPSFHRYCGSCFTALIYGACFQV